MHLRQVIKFYLVPTFKLSGNQKNFDMRIAISGTHCCGKSTLIDEFLNVHSEFTHEPEAYLALEDRGEVFSAEPSADDFIRQLEYCVNRLDQFGQDNDVIFERSPADYLAYLLALERLGRDPTARRLKELSIKAARRGMQNLDIVVFLRPNDRPDEFPDEEDPVLRATVDTCLAAILLDNEDNLLDDDHPLIVEATGSTAERVEALNAAFCTHTHSTANSTRLS